MSLISCVTFPSKHFSGNKILLYCKIEERQWVLYFHSVWSLSICHKVFLNHFISPCERLWCKYFSFDFLKVWQSDMKLNLKCQMVLSVLHQYNFFCTPICIHKHGTTQRDCKRSATATKYIILYLLWPLMCTHTDTNERRTFLSPKGVCIINSVKWSGTKRMNVFTMITEVNTIIRLSFSSSGDPEAEWNC